MKIYISQLVLLYLGFINLVSSKPHENLNLDNDVKLIKRDHSRRAASRTSYTFEGTESVEALTAPMFGGIVTSQPINEDMLFFSYNHDKLVLESYVVDGTSYFKLSPREPNIIKNIYRGIFNVWRRTSEEEFKHIVFSEPEHDELVLHLFVQRGNHFKRFVYNTKTQIFYYVRSSRTVYTTTPSTSSDECTSETTILTHSRVTPHPTIPPSEPKELVLTIPEALRERARQRAKMGLDALVLGTTAPGSAVDQPEPSGTHTHEFVEEAPVPPETSEPRPSTSRAAQAQPQASSPHTIVVIDQEEDDDDDDDDDDQHCNPERDELVIVTDDEEDDDDDEDEEKRKRKKDDDEKDKKDDPPDSGPKRDRKDDDDDKPDGGTGQTTSGRSTQQQDTTTQGKEHTTKSSETSEPASERARCDYGVDCCGAIQDGDEQDDYVCVEEPIDLSMPRRSSSGDLEVDDPESIEEYVTSYHLEVSEDEAEREPLIYVPRELSDAVVPDPLYEPVPNPDELYTDDYHLEISDDEGDVTPDIVIPVQQQPQNQDVPESPRHDTATDSGVEISLEDAIVPVSSPAAANEDSICISDCTPLDETSSEPDQICPEPVSSPCSLRVQLRGVKNKLPCTFVVNEPTPDSNDANQCYPDSQSEHDEPPLKKPTHVLCIRGPKSKLPCVFKVSEPISEDSESRGDSNFNLHLETSNDSSQLSCTPKQPVSESAEKPTTSSDSTTAFAGGEDKENEQNESQQEPHGILPQSGDDPTTTPYMYNPDMYSPVSSDNETEMSRPLLNGDNEENKENGDADQDDKENNLAEQILNQMEQVQPPQVQVPQIELQQFDQASTSMPLTPPGEDESNDESAPLLQPITNDRTRTDPRSPRPSRPSRTRLTHQRRQSGNIGTGNPDDPDNQEQCTIS